MINSSSPEWVAEKAWLEQQIAAAHRTLENPDLSETQTALLRGEIGAWRTRIAAAELAPTMAQQCIGPNTYC